MVPFFYFTLGYWAAALLVSFSTIWSAHRKPTIEASNDQFEDGRFISATLLATGLLTWLVSLSFYPDGQSGW